KIKIDADKFVGELALQLRDQLVFRHPRRPLTKWLERHEEFSVEKSGSVAAVVRTTVLGHHGDDLGRPVNNLAYSVDHRHAGFQRDGRRHRCAYPQIALLKRWQKFASETQCNRSAGNEKKRPEPGRDLSMRKRPAQERHVDRADP